MTFATVTGVGGARRRRCVALVAVGAIVVSVGACGSSAKSGAGAGAGAAGGSIEIVAAENEYGDVAAQIGGQYVKVASVESNPNTDPHSYEVSAGVAQEVADARLVIQNGLGYDDFMTKIESASASASRQVINVQHILRVANSTPNPHLWYQPGTMPAVANQLAADLAAIQPAHAAYFNANAATFIASLQPWLTALASFKATYPDTPVATTEPVGDYLLEAAGTDDLTPFTLQAAVMNGTDPSPQDVTAQTDLLAGHKVKVLIYNQQVTDSLTSSFRAAARTAGIPVVGVYETMPAPGYHYQTWMLAEVNALTNAVAHGTSTERL